MKKLTNFVACTTLLCLLPQFAQAEGTVTVEEHSGVFGANRRVKTLPAPDLPYCGVKGNFTIPTVFVPVGVYIPQPPRNQSPNIIDGRANSKPTFYLGAQQERAGGNFEVDAGIQYEWQAFGTETTRIDPNTGLTVFGYVPPGYSIFVRTSNADFGDAGSPKSWVSPPGGYRFGAGTQNSNAHDVDLKLLFERQQFGTTFKSYLDVFVYGADAQPAESRIYAHHGVSVLAANLAQMRVKRVVGITQGGNSYPGALHFPLVTIPLASQAYYEEDGSYMRGVVFRDGEVATNVASPGWQGWDVVAANGGIDQTNEGTGSAPGPFVRDQTLLSPVNVRGQHLISSLPVINYPDRTDTTQSPVDTQPNRYSFETIDVNLRKAVTVTGNVISVGQTNTGTGDS